MAAAHYQLKKKKRKEHEAEIVTLKKQTCTLEDGQLGQNM
jgi:hypothetical protein